MFLIEIAGIQCCMANSTLESELKKQLKALLDGGQAHAKLDDAVSGVPFDVQGKVPEGLPYSPWQLLEHIRLAQKDILEFSNNADGSYKELKWPDDYWPKSPVPPNEDAWGESVKALKKDRAAFERLLAEGDLTKPFPWGDGNQNLLREALLIADHEAYHTGELVMARRLLGAWKPKKGHA
ncbi:DinB family protein [Terriglobus sp. ADX1]|uniref:DinB family protein n=1 Tax=Terriglobus sp. ADX1 TaxID=2794063 RepID=UPI002FE5DE9C